jgi:enoyl-CoA hydratase/carnithine racemase
MGDLVTYEQKAAGYGVITLNRPEKHNAISLKMARELAEKLQQGKEDTIKFLVISGGRGKMFSAGGDLSDLHGKLSNAEANSKLSVMTEVLQQIVHFPVPVVAALNGNALGGGCELATACDIRIAKEHTKFGFIQSAIGILPGWGGGAVLYKKVNPSFALDWITTGDVYSAAALKEKGWIHHIIRQEHWERGDFLTAYVEKSREQMFLLKAQFNTAIQADSLSGLMMEETASSAGLWESDAHKQALENFSRRKN